MKPMLSATLTDVEAVNFPALCSPKLDGIRCMIVGRVPVTRTLKQIPNRAIFDELRRLGLPELDGELIVGDAKAEDVYRKTNSGVMSRDGEPDWTFWVFDIYEDGPFEARLKTVKNIVAGLRHPRIKVVPHVKITDAQKLADYETKHLLAGYEGVMGRSLGGTYKQGRSTMREGGLWKLKRFTDGEAVILGFDEQMHNANPAKINALGRTERSSHKENKHGTNKLGALKVKDVVSNVEFDIGTGFSDFERLRIWKRQDIYLGRVVKYKSLLVGVKEKPRHPVYLGLRHDI